MEGSGIGKGSVVVNGVVSLGGVPLAAGTAGGDGV